MTNKVDSQATAAPDEHVRFIETLEDETPRGAILVAAQFADLMLLRVLSAACLSPEIATKLLDDFNAPLGTFSTRILAAYALGLVPEDEHWNLEQLRKVRNYCAHSMGRILFTDDKVKSHIDNFRLPPEAASESPQYKLAFVLSGLRVWTMLAIRKVRRQNAGGP